MVSVTELLHIVTSIGFIGFSFLLTGFKRALNYSSEIEFHTTALQLQLWIVQTRTHLNSNCLFFSDELITVCFSDFNFRLSSSHVVLFLVCAILRTMVLFRLIYSFVAIARRTCFWWTKFTNWFRVWVIWGWGFPGCYYFLLNLNCAFLADIGVVI